MMATSISARGPAIFETDGTFRTLRDVMDIGGMSEKRLDARQRERFKRLAWPHRAVLMRTARYLTHQISEAEDLVQETLIKAMNAIDTFHEGTDMKAWLTTILRRAHIDRIRADQCRPATVSLNACAPIELADERTEVGIHDDRWDKPDELLNRFEDQAVIDVLKTLPEHTRWSLILVDVEQMDLADAAGVLEVPVGTIKSRVHRGRSMLRDRLYEVAQRRGWFDDVEATEGASHEA